MLHVSVQIDSLGWVYFTVISSSITTKKLFVSQRFNLHRKSSSGEWKQLFLLPVLGTVSKWCAKKTVVRVADLVAAFFAVHGLLSLLADVNCLLDYLVALSGSMLITDPSDQFITWFSCRAWSVRADLLYSAEVLERWLLVKARLVLNSTSVLCSCNLTPSFLPVSPTYVLSQLAHGTLWTHSDLYLLDVPKMLLRVLHGFMAHGTLYFFMILATASCRCSLYIGNHH